MYIDFRSYGDKLAEIITNSTPRFSVGVFGGWGIGKTSLMLMIKSILDTNPKVVTVWFDAWRYEREENLAVIPFLRTIKLKLDTVDTSTTGNWDVVSNALKRSAASVYSIN